MLEEQLERVRGETKGIGEAVGRAKEVIETLGKEDREGVERGLETDKIRDALVQGRRKEQVVEKKMWEVLEREVGGL